jgi:flagellar hook-basal body complex protein FliE
MIKNVSDLQSILKNHDAGGWSSKVGNEIQDQFDHIETPGIEKSTGAKSFGDMLQESIGKVNAMQNEADVAMQKIASGESKNLHETLLAVERAEIAFKTMNQVRSKVLEAYKEIMRTQI